VRYKIINIRNALLPLHCFPEWMQSLIQRRWKPTKNCSCNYSWRSSERRFIHSSQLEFSPVCGWK